MKINCPSCQDSKSSDYYRNDNYLLKKCAHCSLVFLTPMPTDAQLKNLYNRQYFEDQNNYVLGYKSYKTLEKSLTNEAVNRIKYMKGFTQNRKLLDLGCGLGTFIKVAKGKGYEVSGSDISNYAQALVKKQLASNFYLGPVTENILPKENFGIICAWDVFEHIPQVNVAFGNVYNSLKKDGYLFLTTPNLKSPDAVLLGRYWYGYKKIPEHLIFFSPESITYVLEKNGFKVIEIKPWGFERDFKFIAQKLSLYNPFISKLLNAISTTLKIENKSVYLPLIDMMVVAKKAK